MKVKAGNLFIISDAQLIALAKMASAGKDSVLRTIPYGKSSFRKRMAITNALQALDDAMAKLPEYMRK